MQAGENVRPADDVVTVYHPGGAFIVLDLVTQRRRFSADRIFNVNQYAPVSIQKARDSRFHLTGIHHQRIFGDGGDHHRFICGLRFFHRRNHFRLMQRQLGNHLRQRFTVHFRGDNRRTDHRGFGGGGRRFP